MNILGRFLGNILKNSARSTLSSCLARSPLGVWLLCLCGLFVIFVNGMFFTSCHGESMSLAYLLVGVVPFAFALLMKRGHARAQKIMLGLAAAALLGGMVAGYFANADLYDYAMARFEEGKYEQAKDCFETLDGFRDSEDKIIECDRKMAERIFHANYEDALAMMDRSPEWAYRFMRDLAEDGYEPAIEALATPEFQAAREARYSPGSDVYFGTYHQVESPRYVNADKFSWIIAARDGDRALFVSLYVVDDQPYHDTVETVTWADSSLRRWLNSEFMDIAFTPEEQALIQLTEVENGGGKGVPSQDRVFLLSYDEACRYLTGITGSNGLKGSSSEYMYSLTYDQISSWILRPVEADITTVPCINFKGTLTTLNPRYDSSGIRPAMWITLDPDFF